MYGWSKSGIIHYQRHKLEKACDDSVRRQETEFLSQVFEALYMVNLKLMMGDEKSRSMTSTVLLCPTNYTFLSLLRTSRQGGLGHKGCVALLLLVAVPMSTIFGDCYIRVFLTSFSVKPSVLHTLARCSISGCLLVLAQTRRALLRMPLITPVSILEHEQR